MCATLTSRPASMLICFICKGLLNWHAKNKSDFKGNLNQMNEGTGFSNILFTCTGRGNNKLCRVIDCFPKHFACHVGSEPHDSFVRSECSMQYYFSVSDRRPEAPGIFDWLRVTMLKSSVVNSWSLGCMIWEEWLNATKEKESVCTLYPDGLVRQAQRAWSFRDTE